jgi:hypothetical protein
MSKFLLTCLDNFVGREKSTTTTFPWHENITFKKRKKLNSLFPRNLMYCSQNFHSINRKPPPPPPPQQQINKNEDHCSHHRPVPAPVCCGARRCCGSCIRHNPPWVGEGCPQEAGTQEEASTQEASAQEEASTQEATCQEAQESLNKREMKVMCLNLSVKDCSFRSKICTLLEESPQYALDVPFHQGG